MERKITNNSILLFLGVSLDELDTVVCLTKVGNDFTIDELDATTTCGPAKEPGNVSGTIAIEAQHLLDPATGKVSGHSLFIWAMAGQKLFYRIAPAVPAGGDVIQEGKCFITGLSNNYSYNAQSSFNCNLAIDGIPDEYIEAMIYNLMINIDDILMINSTDKFIL